MSVPACHCSAAPIHGFLEDYVFVIQGLFDLYEASLDQSWLEWALQLQHTQDKLFWDPKGFAYFSSEAGDPSLLLRLKDGAWGPWAEQGWSWRWADVTPCPLQTRMEQSPLPTLLLSQTCSEQPRIPATWSGWKRLGRSWLPSLRGCRRSRWPCPRWPGPLPCSITPSNRYGLACLPPFWVQEWGHRTTALCTCAVSGQVVICGDPQGEDTKEMLSCVHSTFIPNKVEQPACPPPVLVAAATLPAAVAIPLCAQHGCSIPWPRHQHPSVTQRG